jgi:hypothetical protein
LEEAAERFGGFGRCRKIEMIGRRSQKDLADLEEAEILKRFGRGARKVSRISKRQKELENLEEEPERFSGFGRSRTIETIWKRRISFPIREPVLSSRSLKTIRIMGLSSQKLILPSPHLRFLPANFATSYDPVGLW